MTHTRALIVHNREYVAYHVPCVTHLDNMAVLMRERTQSRERFERGAHPVPHIEDTFVLNFHLDSRSAATRSRAVSKRLARGQVTSRVATHSHTTATGEHTDLFGAARTLTTRSVTAARAEHCHPTQPPQREAQDLAAATQRHRDIGAVFQISWFACT